MGQEYEGMTRCESLIESGLRHPHFDNMIAAVVDEKDGFFEAFLTIDDEWMCLAGPDARAGDHKVVEGFVVTVVEFERVPGFGQQWFEVQAVDFHVQTKKRFDN
jgi:hypothetical protein